MRAAIHRNSLELLQATVDVRPLRNPALERSPSTAVPSLGANMQAVLGAVEKQSPENEIAETLKHVDDKVLANALQDARNGRKTLTLH